MFGVMLDCSRNAVMHIDGLKRFILNLEKMGYDCLQLYTEDMYEIKDEPLFGYMRGRYTQAELKEIDAFAKEHGIELIPCIQTLAHLEQLFKYRVFSCVQDVGDILLVGENRTYELIERMFQACAVCFTSRRINIGMDEAHLLGFGKYFDKYGYENAMTIFLAHLNRVCAIAEKYGFKPMMWSDMFFKFVSHGNYHENTNALPKEIIEQLPENLELIYWDYYNENQEQYEKNIDLHLSVHRNIWFAGGAWKWVGFHPQNEKSFRTTKAALSACAQKGLKNVLITLWGDNGNECPANAVLPALVYAIECYKGNYSLEKAKVRFEELFGESWDDFRLMELPMPPTVKKWDSMACGAKEMLYSDCFLSRIDSSVSGIRCENKAYVALAEQLSIAKQRSKNYAYIFESYQRLCELMVEKYDLGYCTRKAYQEDDKDELSRLIDRYSKTLEKLTVFHEAFYKMWVHDNKAHGFDVSDIRLGGVAQRLKTCQKRLNQYVAGELNRIEELEEKCVDFFTGNEPQREMIIWNEWRYLATVNNL